MVLLSELGKDKVAAMAQVQVIADKIHNSLSEPYLLAVSHEEGPDTLVEHRCTASIGVVVFIDHQGEADEIVGWADKAMYQAKDNGRNSISFYEP